MNTRPHIYAVIIGSEILDRRREDQHFDYLSKTLDALGHNLYASMTIKDDATLIANTYTLIKNDPKSIMLSFGGIGSTPDDLTRQIAADVFKDAVLYRHSIFEKDIITRLQEKAYPHPIKMSDLPKDAKLLFNPINNMSGFFLDERFFFMPGFPQMAQPMMDFITSKYLPKVQEVFSMGFIAQCGEGKIQDLMTQVPNSIDLSSLPMMSDKGNSVEFVLSSQNKEILTKEFNHFTKFLDNEKIEYKLC